MGTSIFGDGGAAVPPPPAGAIRKAPAGGAGRGAAKSKVKGKYSDELLDMPCVQFNQYKKDNNLSDAEISDLKKERRRKKNRKYATDSRNRRSTKLNNIEELQSKVAELRKAVS